MPTQSPDLPPRMGPRPLALHLWAAMTGVTISRSAWPMLKSGSLPWSPALRSEADALSQELQNTDPDAFAAALDRELRHRMDFYLTGLDRYRRHFYRRGLTDPPAIWHEGNSRLLDYGATAARAQKGAGKGRPVLVVPSLVNRGYVLDLNEDRSLMRFLAANGLRPMLVEWGRPEGNETGFDLTEYIAGRLQRALVAATAEAGGPVAVVGYCMGGLLALALAGRNPDMVSALALLATPWDFHAEGAGPPPALAMMRDPMTSMIRAIGYMPTDALQTMFFSIDPTQSWIKFRHFAGRDPDSDAARMFVALEDWANDGVPLAGPVAAECLVGWYLDNTPRRGEWRVAGAPVVPEDVSVPALVVVPARDRIVPPASARYLADVLPNAESLTPPAGHIGMIVGSRAADGLWTPLKDWLLRQS